ncbi:ATP-grasp domain-containing protein [Arthrobacter sp. zg-Y1110]|uniref:ATP-grasp domain-containing protein n=1 Tax=Arthrobacter sp. zg-Y1110 TaxID=2886932 RepID=UPI001D135DFB|nr:ATP-grasp domain-containing protein [Arthrobacter sp. zg-Y1110]MCC3292359.1 ATP-grasp domain-containing protein [Arthrobacter sp. zg-Y1110]UWX86738.1 ATP-grasp domain-containing protein [Arthrobacter sp. zg-Y1110]
MTALPISLLLTIFERPMPPEVRPGHEHRAAELTSLWARYVGEPVVSEEADYENFYEQAARLKAAVDAFGENIWLHVPDRTDVVHLGHGARRRLDELDGLPCYGAQLDDRHSTKVLRDEVLASDYFRYEAFTSRLGRRTALTHWLPDSEGVDFIRTIRTLLDDGVTDFFVKATKTKLGIFEFSLPADASDRDIWEALVYRAGYALERTGTGIDALFVQESVTMRCEYRMFIVGQEVVTGGASIEEFTPLERTGAFDTRIREDRRGVSDVVEATETVARLVNFARGAAADLAREQPELQNYVMDVALGADGEPLVIELNGWLNSGLFASDPTLAVGAYRKWLEEKNAALAGHPLIPSALNGRTLCACGSEAGLDGYVNHASEVAGVGPCTAAELLSALHYQESVNAGCCGGCEPCGGKGELVVCAVCGEGDSPCLTYWALDYFEDPSSFQLTVPRTSSWV